MAEFIIRGMPRLLNTPLLGFLRASAIPNTTLYTPCLGGNSRGQWTNASVSCRYKSGGPLNLGNSTTKKRADNGELYGALQIGKSSKKWKSKRKNQYQNTPSLSSQLKQEQEEILVFAPQPKWQFKNNSTNKMITGNKLSVDPASNTSSFLTSLGNQTGYTNRTNKKGQRSVNSTTLDVDADRATSFKLAEKERSKNKPNTLLKNGTVVSSMQTSSNSRVDKAKGNSNSRANDSENSAFLIDELYETSLADYSRTKGDLSELDHDVAASTKWIQGEERGIKPSLPSSPNKKSAWKVKTKIPENQNEDLKCSFGVCDRQNSCKEYNKNRKAAGESSSMDYEHLLYNEKRHQRKFNDSDELYLYGNNRNTQGKHTKGIATSNHANLNKNEPKVYRTMIGEKEEKTKGLKRPSSNELPTSFILVEEVSNLNDQTRENRTASGFDFSNEVDAMIQDLQIQRWEKVVRKSLEDVKEKTQPRSFVLVNDNSVSVPNTSSKKGIYSEANSQFSNEHVFLDPQDQVGGHAFRSNNTSYPLSEQSINVSKVPNNTAKLASQVNIEELKPVLSKKSTLASTANISQVDNSQSGYNEMNRPRTEPVLSVQPDEIINRKSAGKNLEKIDKTKLTSPYYSKDVQSKFINVTPWSKELLNAMEKSTKRSQSNRQNDELPSNIRKESEFPSSNQMDLIKAKKGKKEKKSKGDKNTHDNIKKGSRDDGVNKCISDTIPSKSLTTAGNDVPSKADIDRNVHAVTDVVKGREQKDYLEALREQWKAEFRQGFLEMQKDRLVKKSSNSQPGKSTLVYTPNSFASWLADTHKTEKKNDKGNKKKLKKKVKKEKNNYVENQNQGCNDKVVRPSNLELLRNQIYENERLMQSIKANLKNASDLDHRNIASSETKAHEKTKSIRSNNITETESDKNLEEFCKMKDEHFYTNVLGEGSLSPSAMKGLLKRLEKMDGFMTMELIPVHDSPPQQKSDFTAQLINNTNAQRSAMLKDRELFEKNQLERNLMALRRYQERPQTNKEDKKKKKKKTTKRKTNDTEDKPQRGTLGTSKST